MEIAIVKNDTSRRVGLSQSQIVIQDKFKRGVANQIALHLNAPIDRTIDDVTWTVEQNVDLLVNVDEYIVCVVFVVDGNWRSWGVDGAGAE